MGGIWGSREFFVDALTEIAGYKAGVALSERELFEIMRDEGDVGRILDPDGPGGGRVHSSSFEEAVTALLHRLGNIPSDIVAPIAIEMLHRYRGGEKEAIHTDLFGTYVRLAEAGAFRPVDGALDPSPLILELFERHGSDGTAMAMELLEGINRDMHRSPWGSVRSVEWRDAVELEGLFRSAGLETQHGGFLDQRYIDYLAQNFDRIGEMHWRKFEGLTAEFFQRGGYRVALGPGGNDDGVDLRVYPADARPDRPPMILVQCKRQKEKIGKSLVKSVYADVLHEKADSGLIVTTSKISPGAEATRTARNYPVETADRATLRTWLDKLRSDARRRIGGRRGAFPPEDDRTPACAARSPNRN